MRDYRKDTTILGNNQEKYDFLMGEYERVKRKEHPAYKLAKVFFNKYYNRYKQSEIYKIYFPENGSEV